MGSCTVTTWSLAPVRRLSERAMGRTDSAKREPSRGTMIWRYMGSSALRCTGRGGGAPPGPDLLEGGGAYPGIGGRGGCQLRFLHQAVHQSVHRAVHGLG